MCPMVLGWISEDKRAWAPPSTLYVLGLEFGLHMPLPTKSFLCVVGHSPEKTTWKWDPSVAPNFSQGELLNPKTMFWIDIQLARGRATKAKKQG